MSNSTSYLITPNRAISTVDMNVGKMGQQNGVVHILILDIKVYKINRLVWQRPNNIMCWRGQQRYRIRQVAWNTYVTFHQHEHLITQQNGVDILILHIKAYRITRFDWQRPKYVLVRPEGVLEFNILIINTLQSYVHNSCKTLIGVHEMHGRMHPN